MATTSDGPDEGLDDVTEAALAAVSEAVELADEQNQRKRGLRRLGRRQPGAGQPGAGQARPRRLALRRRRLGKQVTAEVAVRAERAKGIRHLGTALGRAARHGAHVTGRGVSAGGRWLSEQVLAMAPRLPVRGIDTLRAQFPGRSPDQLAETLIEGASRASAAVGIAVGTWAVLPFLPAAGVEIATETLSVVGIEIKLVAELHEVYGLAVTGGPVERTTAYVGAWAQRRGVALAPGGILLAAGSPLARQLQRRLAARAGRSVFSLGPLLTGAAAGGIINRRETRKLGRAIRDDLRKRSPYKNAWPI